MWVVVSSSSHQQQQQPQDGSTQPTDLDKKHRSSKRRRRKSRGILSAIVSGEPAHNDDDDSSAVSDDSSSAEVTPQPSRRRLGRGYYSRPMTERLTASTPRGQFVSQRSRTSAFQRQKCSSLIARDYHAVDATVADITDRKCTLLPDIHTTQPAGVVSGAGTSNEVAVLRGSNTQLTKAAAVDQTDCSPFSASVYRQKYCTWPLDSRSTTNPPIVDGSTDAKSHGFQPPNVGRLQRQNAVDLRPPSTVEMDQLSRPSATSASRSTGNVSVDKTEVIVKPPSPLQLQREQQHTIVEPEGNSRAGHIAVATAAANENATSDTHAAPSLPRMTVTAFWHFVMSRYGRNDPRSEAERLRRKQQKKKENRARKALRTITIILGAFVLCWTPWHWPVPRCYTRLRPPTKTSLGNLHTISRHVGYKNPLKTMLSWTPWHVLSLLIGFCGGGGDGATETADGGSSCVSTTLYDISYWLCYLNSPINPFCYAFVNYQFKKTFIRIIRLDWHRN